MINRLLKLLVYTAITLLYTAYIVSKCFANPEPATKFIPKNVDEIFKCKQCCKYYGYTKACDIFYNLCMTKAFHDGVFMFSRKNFTYPDAYNAAIKYFTHDSTTNIILILVNNNRVYFNKKKYEEFKKEVEANIEKKEMQKLLTDVLTQIKSNLDYKDEVLLNKLIKGSIYRNTYDNINNISSVYITTIKWYSKQIKNNKGKNTIVIYNKGHKELCIKKVKPTKIAMLKTTLPISSSFITSYNKNTIITAKSVISNTLPITNSVVINNRSFVDVYQKPTSYKSLEKYSTSIPLIIMVATTVVLVGIIATASFFIYKKCNRNKPEIDTTLEGDNKNTKAASIDDIYEEPYALPYNSIQLVIDDKDNDRSHARISQSEEHVYIPCVNDSDFKSSNDTLTDTNNSSGNSSLHEQQDIITETENDGKTTPTYYTLEDSNIIQE